MNAEEPVTTVDPLQRDRIVEVAGVDRVDGHDRLPGEVATIRRHGLVEPFRLPPGVVEHRLGKRPGQAELVDHGLRVDADGAGAAEHVDDHPFAVAHGGGKPHDFHDHLVVGPHAPGPGIAHGHRPGEPGAVDLHPAAADGFEVRADEPGGPTLHDLHDLAGRSRPADVAGFREPDADVPAPAVAGAGTRMSWLASPAPAGRTNP